MKHPDWAVKYRRPGTELRRITEKRYCLYECSSVYDKEKKRARKVTGKYLGSITEEGGFKESRKRVQERELEEARRSPSPASEPAPAVKVGAVKEYGLSRYIIDCQADTMERLKRHFPDDWRRIVALVYCRLRHQSPLRYVQGDFADSFLSTQAGTRGLSANALSAFMQELGGMRPEMVAYMRELSAPGDCLIFDGSDILSASRLMDYPQMSKTKIGTFDNVVNMMWVFNSSRHLPVYFRLLPGNIKDVSAFKLCLEDAGVADGVAIVDKGFHSDDNVKALDQLPIKYTMSVRRSTKGLDYAAFASRDNSGADGHFLYNGRLIWWKGLQIYGHDGFLYLDEVHRTEESGDYMRRVEDPKQEKYTMEGYRLKALQFGTLALMTTAGKDAEGTYVDYKTRGDVEQTIDVFKNCLEADTSYMQNEKTLEAWMFVNLIAMQWYYDIRCKLVESKLIAKFSPMAMVRQLARAKVVRIENQWMPAEMTKKEMQLAKAIGVHIT